jgi:glutaredoxin
LKTVHVEGENKGHIILYTLSTCAWCKKVKKILNKLGVEYYYSDVDLLVGEERQETVEEIKNWNPACTFPTLVINKEKCIVGANKNEIKEILGI